MTKTIRFYRITDQDRLPFPNAFPFDGFQSLIDGLDDKEAYVQLNRMELLGSSWRPRSSGPGARAAVPLVALDRITREPQIRIERRRNYRPLVLNDGENLADPTFFAVFADNVIGVMRTSTLAPGPTSIRDYVNALKVVEPAVDIVPLVDGNALRALSEVGTLTKFTIRVLPDASEDLFQSSRMIYDAVHSARQTLGSVAVELSVSIAAKGQSAAAEEARAEIANVVTSDAALGSTDKAEIRYRRLEDGKADGHDFLKEALTKAVEVEIDAQTGQPAETSVAEALAKAYDSLYDDIRSALHSAN